IRPTDTYRSLYLLSIFSVTLPERVRSLHTERGAFVDPAGLLGRQSGQCALHYDSYPVECQDEVGSSARRISSFLCHNLAVIYRNDAEVTAGYA
ncbi:hypothetical protein, partial [Citrobacter sp. wls826]|uniref:hypothetical protein n=1 Tax=Citrobacter sp. wls826 TaxID=2576415 RepID=UPI001BB036D2